MNKIMLFLLSVVSCFGQTYPYGKVSKELLMLTECTLQKDANAMITYKSGERDVDYTDTEGFITSIKFKKQIKIFNSDAKDIGTISFFYYSPKISNYKFTLSDVKGRTYNIEGDKIVETEISQENIQKIQYNNYYKRATITMPAIRKGCIFEFEYNLSANTMANIDDYEIQEYYPVLYNKLSIRTPEYFNFQINLTGSIVPQSDKTSQSRKTINYKRTYDGNELTGRRSEVFKFEMPFNNRTLIFESVPAFVEEPFSLYAEGSKGMISHQLLSIQMPDEPIKLVATSYEKVNEDLNKDSDFGGTIKKGSFIDNIFDYKLIDDTLKRAESIYNHFVNNIAFDGYLSYYASKSGSKLFNDGKGDVGDINLNYIAALKHAGIETYPVVLRTLGDGILHPIYPNYSHINYVVAVSVINGRDYFSDATSGLPFGALPKRCLNGDGWLVGPAGGGWVSLNKNSIGKQITQTKIVKVGNKLAYSTKLYRGQTFAFEDNNVLKKDGQEGLLEYLEKLAIIKSDSAFLTNSAVDLFKYKLDHSIEIEDDATIFIDPFIYKPFDVNPFVSLTRTSPISFIYNKDYKMSTTIEIPLGYTYETVQNLNLSLDENEIVFKYNSSFNASTNLLTINTDFKINQAIIGPDKYEGVKVIIGNIIEKLEEPVVIKKL